LVSAKLTKQQIQTLASFLTVSETYFWRERPVFDALTEYVIPQIMHSKVNKKRSIRIWSAGCSSGEEVYSLAIALHRTIANIREWDIKVLGTDINPVSLQKAKEGIYSKWSFRNCPGWLRAAYFRQNEDDTFEILPKIKKMVEFQSVNLTEETFPSFHNDIHSFDMIFCRNVLMYLTEEWISKITESFYHSLSQNGWFVVSSCELSSQRFFHFAPVNFPGAVLYNKGNNEFTTSQNIPTPKNQTYFPMVETTAHKTSNETKSFIVFNDRKSDIKPIQAEPPVVAETPQPKEIIPPIEARSQIIERVREIANTGDLDRALEYCNVCLISDKLFRELYFVRSSILQELNRPAEAIESLKQSIYLDPDFIMGYFVLGNLCIQEGKLKKAKKYFNNVLDLLNSCHDDDILPESEGLSVKFMREIIVPNMQKLTHL